MSLENSAQLLAGQAKKKRKASGGSSWANAAWMKARKESQVNERLIWIELREINKLSCVIQTLPRDSSKISPKMVSTVCLLNVPTKTLSVLIWKKIYKISTLESITLIGALWPPTYICSLQYTFELIGTTCWVGEGDIALSSLLSPRILCSSQTVTWLGQTYKLILWIKPSVHTNQHMLFANRASN